jgi:hypothetical protein
MPDALPALKSSFERLEALHYRSSAFTTTAAMHIVQAFANLQRRLDILRASSFAEMNAARSALFETVKGIGTLDDQHPDAAQHTRPATTRPDAHIQRRLPD